MVTKIFLGNALFLALPRYNLYVREIRLHLFPQKNQEIGVKAIEKFKAEIENSILENGFFLKEAQAKLVHLALEKGHLRDLLF